MPNTPSAFVASGNIYPFRAVKISGDHTVAQSGANEWSAGIARGSTNQPPLNDLVTTNYHAQSGDIVHIIGDDEEGYMEIGDTVTAGQLLKPDTNGKGVPVAGSGLENVIAEALMGGAASNIIRVRCLRLKQTTP